MEWYEDYDFIFEQFAKGKEGLDETNFYFYSDPKRETHYIGFLPEYNEPYWVGLCDIEDGCTFKTAKEMFEAKIYDGKSIKDRWEDIHIMELGGMSIDDWDISWLKDDTDDMDNKKQLDKTTKIEDRVICDLCGKGIWIPGNVNSPINYSFTCSYCGEHANIDPLVIVE